MYNYILRVLYIKYKNVLLFCLYTLFVYSIQFNKIESSLRKDEFDIVQYVIKSSLG